MDVGVCLRWSLLVPRTHRRPDSGLDGHDKTVVLVVQLVLYSLEEEEKEKLWLELGLVVYQWRSDGDLYA